jgi:hypothetical protein
MEIILVENKQGHISKFFVPILEHQQEKKRELLSGLSHLGQRDPS